MAAAFPSSSLARGAGDWSVPSCQLLARQGASNSFGLPASFKVSYFFFKKRESRPEGTPLKLISEFLKGAASKLPTLSSFSLSFLFASSSQVFGDQQQPHNCSHWPVRSQAFELCR